MEPARNLLSNMQACHGKWVFPVHQVLTMNSLRDKVVLRTDGGLKTGRDIVMAAMLGADEYGIGTSC